jgi:hypothetical protein
VSVRSGSAAATGTGDDGTDHIKRITSPTSCFNSLFAELLFPAASAVVIVASALFSEVIWNAGRFEPLMSVAVN